MSVCETCGEEGFESHAEKLRHYASDHDKKDWENIRHPEGRRVETSVMVKTVLSYWGPLSTGQLAELVGLTRQAVVYRWEELQNDDRVETGTIGNSRAVWPADLLESSGEARPYQCPWCDYEFYQSKDFGKHTAQNHRDMISPKRAMEDA